MDRVIALAVAAIAGLGGVGALWFGLRGLRSRYRHLLAAIELSQRQLTELRQQQDGLIGQTAALAERLDGLLEIEVVHRLREQVVPPLARLDRDLELRAALASLERGESEGKVSRETAERMRRELGGLAEANAAGERPY